jgi:hypothetical protein
VVADSSPKAGKNGAPKAVIARAGSLLPPTRLRSTAVRILEMRWVILSRSCGTGLVGNYTQHCMLG